MYFPGTLQIFVNALLSEEPEWESAMMFIRGLDIAWASQSSEVDLFKSSLF